LGCVVAWASHLHWQRVSLLLLLLRLRRLCCWLDSWQRWLPWLAAVSDFLLSTFTAVALSVLASLPLGLAGTFTVVSWRCFRCWQGKPLASASCASLLAQSACAAACASWPTCRFVFVPDRVKLHRLLQIYQTLRVSVSLP